MKKREALLAFLTALGCDVRNFGSHAMIRFGEDNPWADFSRETVIKFCREARALVGDSRIEWHAAGQNGGELSW